MGADATVEAAQDEVAAAAAAGFGAARVVQRGSWYRTVIPFETEQSAEAGQAELQKQAVFRDRGLYIKPQGSWCPQADFNAESGVFLGSC
ncbi:MAG: SPOR domain-containing protein [Prochlorothrix sp.]